MKRFWILMVFFLIGSTVFSAPQKMEPKLSTKKHKVRHIKPRVAKRFLNDHETLMDQIAKTHFEDYKNSLKIADKEKILESDTRDYLAILEFISRSHKKISSEDAHTIASEIIVQSKDNKIDPKFVAALIAVESGFNKNAKSRSGAKGLGQLMTSTYKKFNITNPFDISENVYATLGYLSRLINHWDGEAIQLSLTVASYLKGTESEDGSKVTFSPFTLKYIKMVLNKYILIHNIRSEMDEKNISLTNL